MASQASKLLREIWNSNEDAVRDKAVKLIEKILRNVLKNPTEAKFRKIKRSAIDKRLSNVRGALQILAYAGFTSHGEQYVLPETSDLSSLVEVVEVLDKRAKERIEAEAKLRTIMESNAKKVKAKMAQKELHRKQVRAQHAQAQKELRNKVVMESKANQLQFGMKLKKFEPPKEQPRGG